jgi:ribonucleoside-diphosphate reductase alpha chain
MPRYENYVPEMKKRTKDRYDTSNPEFTKNVKMTTNKEQSDFEKNIHKWKKFVQWARWYPDLFLDLITPDKGGIRLDLDQRVMLRCIMRFICVYGVFPRGYGKTMIEVLAQMLMIVFYPNLQTTMTAQTRENAAKLLKEKFPEICKFYPLLKNEIVSAKFQKDIAEIHGSTFGKIDIMANHHSSKGARRHRMMVEESALLDNDLFENALEPIVNIPRRTVSKNPSTNINPEELNGQICFFTTSGFRNSDEWHRCIKLVDSMAECKGVIFLSADWKLACYYGRGETETQIREKQKKLSPVAFAQNYESKWVGTVEGQLVDVNKLLKCRSLVKFEDKWDGKSEYILGVDVARSYSKANNQTSVSVLKLKRDNLGRVNGTSLVNLFTIAGTLNFSGQAVEVKKIKNTFNASVVVVDTNGLGIGLCDELLKENRDPITERTYECWDTINTDNLPEYENAEKCVFDLKPQTDQNGIIVSFIDAVTSGRLRLLERKSNLDYDGCDTDEKIPYIQTDLLIEELCNLKTKIAKGNKLSLDKNLAKIDKDRAVSLMYALWYIKTYESNIYIESDEDEFEKYIAYVG